ARPSQRVLGGRVRRMGPDRWGWRAPNGTPVSMLGPQPSYQCLDLFHIVLAATAPVFPEVEHDDGTSRQIGLNVPSCLAQRGDILGQFSYRVQALYESRAPRVIRPFRKIVGDNTRAGIKGDGVR